MAGEESEVMPAKDQSDASPDPNAVAPASVGFRWGLFASYLATFALVLVVVGLLAALIVGRGPLQSKAATLATRTDATISIDWPKLQRPANAPPPATMEELTWMPRQLRERLLTEAYAAIEREPDPFSASAVAAAGEAMRASGWFSGYPRVERGGPGQIRITGDWRIPAAAVRVGDKEILVAWDGYPLPVVYDAAHGSGLPVISGSVDEPIMLAPGRPDCAKPWPGGDVQSGLELLALLLQQPYAEQVIGVDVGRHRDEKSLEILTKGGARIVWGGRPAKPLLGEASTAAKLAKLDWLNKNYGRIDAGRSAQAPIEVWWPLDRPLEMDRSASASAAAPTGSP